MSKRFYFVALAVLVIGMMSFHTAFSTDKDTDIILIPDIYSSAPDIANCKEGALKESEKVRILDYVNKIRAIHKLKPVVYDYAGDEAASKGAMVCAANNGIQHDMPKNWECYSDKANSGTLNSNLYIQWLGGQNYPQSEVSVVGWMHDFNQPSLGHRRAIINPFVNQMSFGRADGKPKVASQYPFVSTMALKYMDNLNQNVTDMDIEYVAYPYNYYPPILFNKSWLMSFSAIYDKSNWWNNQNVDYNSAVVEVKDEQNNALTVHSISWDNQGWGGLLNCLKWKAEGIVEGVKYNVTISNIKVNNVNKTYTYWFNLGEGQSNAPAAVILAEPANNSTNIPDNIFLKWNAVSGADSYQFQIAKNSDFNPVSIDMNTGNTKQVLVEGLTPNTTYYWRVAASNSVGTGPWSQVWNFKTEAQSSITPVLTAPPDKELMVSLTPKLFWQGVNDATAYQLQVASNKDFLAQTLFINEQNITQTKYAVPSSKKLGEKRLFYWRVRKALPQEGEWSTVWSFTTQSSAETGPVLVSPPNNEEDVSITPLLTWDIINDATAYQIQVDITEDFLPQSIALDKQVQDESTLKISDSDKLMLEFRYYWRVRKIMPTYSPWSETFTFLTTDAVSVRDIEQGQIPFNLVCRPNPIDNNAEIEIHSEIGGLVSLKLYNSLGEIVLDLHSGRLSPGLNQFKLEANHISSGTYYLRLLSAGKTKTLLLQIRN